MTKKKTKLPNELLAQLMIVVDIEQVAALTTLSASKINLMISKDKDYSDPSFPRPSPLVGEAMKPGRRIVWVLDEVLSWIKNQIIKDRGELPECLKENLAEINLG
jgi:predicted DNA-binding transcriptional regulator AlpA